jgi:hypothetical protein
VAPDGSITDSIDVNVSTQDQLVPDLAFNGERYLVAWHDRRVAPEHVFYTQVTADGTVLDPEGIELVCADTIGYQGMVGVGSNGDGYLLAWVEYRVRGVTVRATRITADGAVLDTTAFELTPDSLSIDNVVVGSDGSDYIVLWTGETPGARGADLCFRRISADGTVLDSVPVLVARSSYGLVNVRVSFLGDRYCAVWEGMAAQADIYAALILADGTVLDPNGFPVSAAPGIQGRADVATDGERFFVVWSELAEDGFDILGAFVDTSGAVGILTVFPRRTKKPAACIPTIVRGSLLLGAGHDQPRDMTDFRSGKSYRVPRSALLDVSGRRVLDLHPGENDVRGLAPGAYFLRFTAADGKPATSRLVIVD